MQLSVELSLELLPGLLIGPAIHFQGSVSISVNSNSSYNVEIGCENKKEGKMY